MDNALNSLISQYVDEGWIYRLGYVSDADLELIYAGAQTFIYPSQYEGFGLPILEAMASGVPVITSNYSCLPETSGGAAILVDTNNIDELF